jgi:hypothetical protein
MNVERKDWDRWRSMYNPPLWAYEIALQTETIVIATYQELLDFRRAIMASVEELQASVDTLTANVSAASSRVAGDLQALSAKVADLQAQLAAGTGVDPAALDAVKAGIDTAAANVAAIDPTAAPAA